MSSLVPVRIAGASSRRRARRPALCPRARAGWPGAPRPLSTTIAGAPRRGGREGASAGAGAAPGAGAVRPGAVRPEAVHPEAVRPGAVRPEAEVGAVGAPRGAGATVAGARLAGTAPQRCPSLPGRSGATTGPLGGVAPGAVVGRRSIRHGSDRRGAADHNPTAQDNRPSPRFAPHRSDRRGCRRNRPASRRDETTWLFQGQRDLWRTDRTSRRSRTLNGKNLCLRQLDFCVRTYRKCPLSTSYENIFCTLESVLRIRFLRFHIFTHGC